MMIKFI
jgi:hypothetical protein